MTEAADCVFCKIIQGKIPSVKVVEDEQTLTFMDIQPASPGHTLVIPKAHAANLMEIAEADLLAVTKTVQRISRAINTALKPDGIRIVQTNGAAAGQTVLHYHVHLIPMQEGQRIGTHGRVTVDMEQLGTLAKRIGNSLGV